MVVGLFHEVVDYSVTGMSRSEDWKRLPKGGASVVRVAWQ